MMGICNACFGRSDKYLGTSPVDDSYLQQDAQKLLPKDSPRISVISGEPAKHCVPEKESLVKTEGGDSGTCVDELCEKKDVSPPRESEPEKEQERGPREESAGAVEQETVQLLEQDPVQLTVSSIGSIGGTLEDVPEQGELETDEHSSDYLESENTPLMGEQQASLPRPAPQSRHHSFGSQRTILTANPVEG